MGQKMLLVCPNCGAQYEVDAGIIPDTGRDVQCSNCGHTWWQTPQTMEPAEDAQPDPQPDPQPEPQPDPQPDPEPQPEAPPTPDSAAAAAGGPETETETETEAETETSAEAPAASAMSAAWHGQDEDTAQGDQDGDQDGDRDSDRDGGAAPAGPGDAAPQRRTLDAAVLDVLRQEAALETGARRAEDRIGESGPVEAETEATVRERLEMMRAEGDARTRAGRLPDIDQINSTLEGPAIDEPPPPAEAEAPELERRNRGFRIGFTLIFFVAVGILLTYNFSSEIVARAPGLEPQIDAFTRTVDVGRLWLDSAALNATDAILDLTHGGE